MEKEKPEPGQEDHEAAAADLFTAIENADHHASNADCRAAGEDLSQACPLAEAHKIRAIVLIAAALSEAVRVALVEERKTSAEMLKHQADGFDLRLRVAVEKEREAGKDAAMAAWDAGWAACELFASTHKHRFITDEDGCIWPCQCGAIFQEAMPARSFSCTHGIGFAYRCVDCDAQATPAPEKPHVCTYECANTDCEHVVGPPPETGEKEKP